ncbi:hypothetical protein [Streptomyces asiaticus]|uniref:hypothetical protein n=1 Tax=Streptomyces asiaticus TaxID=114695 RepID=UPI001BAC1050|nr:hypothetical protein [Streptomyces asiaticus]
MSDTITMRHPTLPKDQEIEVPRESMPHYTAAGWQQVPTEELEKRAALKAQAEAAAAAAEERATDKAETAEPADEPEKSEPAEPTERPARSRAKAHEKKAEES